MSDLLVIDGSTTKVITVGDDLGETSKDAVVYPLDPDVAELIRKLLVKNNKLAQQVVGAGDMFMEQMLPLMQQAFFEGAEAQSNASTQPLDENGFPVLVGNPYSDKIRARNELRGM